MNLVFGKLERLLGEIAKEASPEVAGEKEESLCDDQVAIERHFGQLEKWLREARNWKNRVVELEDALRQSVLIVSEREKDFFALEETKRQLTEKVT